MLSNIVVILEQVKNFITDESDMMWTRYKHAIELRDELDQFINQLKNGNTDFLPELNVLFAPTGCLQEHSMSNYWADEYIKLSSAFDDIYLKLRKGNLFE